MGRFGYRIEKETSRDDLLQLLKMQTPIDVGVGLIRVGSMNDGGYLLPNDLSGISKCISPGCDQNASFEDDLLNKFGIASVIIDKAIAKPKELNTSHEYIEKWLGSIDTSEFITLNSVTGLHSHGDLMLQMDIEGAEYEVLISLSKKELEKFRIILIEFHFLSQLKSKIKI